MTRADSLEAESCEIVDGDAVPLNAAHRFWRRNLVGLFVAQTAVIFGTGLAGPFIPIFLRTELGITDASDVARWTGLSFGCAAIGSTVAGPLWGAVADRWGARITVFGTLVGAGGTTALTALSRSALDLVMLRLGNGVLSSWALIMIVLQQGTPRSKIGFATGVLQSSVGIALAFAPLVGGLLAGMIGLRASFAIGGLCMFVAAASTSIVVRYEPTRPKRKRADDPRQPGAVEVLRTAGRRTLVALTVPMGALLLIWASTAAAQPLLVLRLIELVPSDTTLLAGVALSIGGIATAVGSVCSVRFVAWLGYRRGIMFGAACAGTSFLLMAAAPSLGTLISAATVASFFRGALLPAAASMLGLESPDAIRGTVVGISFTAIGIGVSAGPMVAGFTASVAGVSLAMVTAAAWMGLLSLIFLLWAHDPSSGEAPSQTDERGERSTLREGR